MILLIVLNTVGCRHVAEPARCTFADFAPAPYDHIIQRLEPAEVRVFEGRVVSDDIVGEWPDGLDAQFEIHGADRLSKIVTVQPGGRFAAALKPGTYCFKFSATGFRSMLGEITINRNATRREPLVIRPVIAE